MICIQFHLESIGLFWKLLNDQMLSDVKYTLDNIMKLRTSQGVGISVCKAQILSHFDEELLWSLGLLGTANGETLLNTVVFMIGKGFALRVGKEHHALCGIGFNSQITFVRDNEGDIFLRYKEDIGLKTNKGGIKQCKIEPKEVDLYPIDREDQCPVRIILFYLSKLPKDRTCSSFYLQPKKKVVDSVWFQDRPAGCNRLRDTIKELCRSANLPGFYSNHSLRSVAATKMYRNNIDEQLIQEITGHRSVAVRSYKRTSNEQCKLASNCIFSA